MRQGVFVGLGGFLGAVARYVVVGWFQQRVNGFPVGTLAVNVVGSLVLGFFVTLGTGRHVVPPEYRLFFLTGFFDAFTTFSAFSYETVSLGADGRWNAFLGNIGLSVGLSIGACMLGVMLARWVSR